MTDKTNDPVAVWQKMVGEMEKGFNSFANKPCRRLSSRKR